MEKRMVEEAVCAADVSRLRSTFAARAKAFKCIRTTFFVFPGLLVMLRFVISGGEVDNEQTLPLSDGHIAAWDQDDPRLHQHIRRHYLYQPASREEPYNLAWPEKRDFSHKRQSMVANEILGGRRNGFFLEAGAYDGETMSNSLYFERDLNWTGVMVEPDLANIKTFMTKKRKCYLVRGCIGSSRNPQKLTFYGARLTGTATEHMTFIRYWTTQIWQPLAHYETWCWPLPAITKALNRTKIDYFILDVEGHEKSILDANDFNNIDVDVFQVEYVVFAGVHFDKDMSQSRLGQYRAYFKENHPGYSEHSRISFDIFYAKNELMKSTKLAKKQ